MDSAGFPLVDPRFAFVVAWSAAMLRACWQGVIAIALVWALCAALPKMSPRIRCWLWRLAYLKLLVALVWSSTVDLRLLPPPPVRHVLRKRVVPVVPAPRSTPHVSSPSRTAPTVPLPPLRRPYLACALLTLWLLIVFGFAARFIGECCAIRRLRRASKTLHDELLMTMFADLCKQLRVRPPLLLQSDELDSPIVIGMLRPTIIVPSSAASLSSPHGPSSELPLLLAHELAHVKRRDLLWGVLPALAQALFLFHPLVWLAWREWKFAQESACDEQALLTTNASIADYGNVLLKVATNNRSPLRSQLVAVGVVESFQSLKRRMVMMEHVGQVTRKRLLLTGALVMSLGVMGIVPWRVIAQSGGTWTTTNTPMTTARSGHTATRLLNGKVLVAGGILLSSAEIYNPVTGSFSVTGSMSTARAFHTATLLTDGTVLIAGGSTSGNVATAAAEIYDPVAGTFAPTVGSMSTARYQHTATLLNDGTVLVTGGGLNSAEIYDPATGTFSPTSGSMNDPRINHSATLLSDGKVLVAGGSSSPGVRLASAELYDPVAGTFAYTAGSMITARDNHTATRLADGSVLIAGGISPLGAEASAELYNPSTRTFSATTGSMSTARYRHTATLLADGTVLVAGGATGPSIVATAEVYNPAAGGTFSDTGSMGTARYLHAATLLADGSVLATGGNTVGDVPTASAETYAAPAPANGAPVAVVQAPSQVISANNIDATVTLDGSSSSDPDNDPLTYTWFVDGTQVATTAITTVTLSVGTHLVELDVSDGTSTGTASVFVDVITAGPALTSLASQVNSATIPAGIKNALNASLNSAAASFNRGDVTAGVSQLQAFINKVRAQTGKSIDAATAAALIAAAQNIINAVAGG